MTGRNSVRKTNPSVTTSPAELLSARQLLMELQVEVEE